MGGRKRSEVFTTYSGRSTVIEMFRWPFKKILLFWGEKWRVRVFCGLVVLKEHETLSPTPRARAIHREERTNHTRWFLCISGDQARKRRS